MPAPPDYEPEYSQRDQTGPDWEEKNIYVVIFPSRNEIIKMVIATFSHNSDFFPRIARYKPKKNVYFFSQFQVYISEF